MNRAQKRLFDKQVKAKMNEAMTLQKEIKTNKTNIYKFEKLKKVYQELEAMGVIRKKTRLEKLKSKAKSYLNKFILWRNVFD